MEELYALKAALDHYGLKAGVIQSSLCKVHPSVYVAVSITMLTSIVSLVLYFRKKNLPTV